MDTAQVLAAIRDSVAYARELAEDVEFSAEDAIRTERDFLIECLSAAAAAGATHAERARHGRLHHARGDLRPVPPPGRACRPPGRTSIFSAHCHDDLGMAVANSLAAVRGGARQVECAVNGIGERAGNCALEDVVMALKTRSDTYGVTTGVDTTRIMAASRTLAQITNVRSAAEQGDRRRQCLRPRSGHPPAWRASESGDLRDHETGRYRACHGRHRPRQA